MHGRCIRVRGRSGTGTITNHVRVNSTQCASVMLRLRRLTKSTAFTIRLSRKIHKSSGTVALRSEVHRGAVPRLRIPSVFRGRALGWTAGTVFGAEVKAPGRRKARRLTDGAGYHP